MEARCQSTGGPIARPVRRTVAILADLRRRTAGGIDNLDAPLPCLCSGVRDSPSIRADRCILATTVRQLTFSTCFEVPEPDFVALRARRNEDQTSVVTDVTQPIAPHIVGDAFEIAGPDSCVCVDRQPPYVDILNHAHEGDTAGIRDRRITL